MNVRFRAVSFLRGSLAVAALFLTGCVGRFERPRVPVVINDKDPESGKYTLKQYETDLGDYNKATDDTARISLRNKMVYGLMSEIDYAFYDYETKLFLNQGTFNVGSDALQLGLAAAGTITNGQRGKTILSALLSGLSGVSLSIDKNFFRQQTIQAISSSMEAERDRLKTVILQQLKQPAGVYPFQAARADLIRYFFAGTLPAGLQNLSQQSAVNAQTHKANLNQVQVKNITVQDVQQVTAAHAAITQALQTNNLSKLIPFLQAMGFTVDNNTPKDKLEEAVQDLGDRITTDESLRTKYFAAAKTAGLIP